MIDFIKMAGWGIYPVFIFGFSAVFVAVRHLMQQKKSQIVTAKWLMALTGMAGVLGTVTGLQMSSRHIHEIPEKWIFLIGLDESLNNMVAAGVLIVIAMLVMLFAHVRGSGDAEPARVPATT